MRTLIRTTGAYPPPLPNTVLICIHPSPWDDFGYKTLFFLSVFDTNGINHPIGDVKIGNSLPLRDGEILNILENNSEELGITFFSLGQDATYYENIFNLGDLGMRVLLALQDIVAVPKARKVAESLEDDRNIFLRSLLRTVSYQTFSEQYSRILRTNIVQETFDFQYTSPAKKDWGEISLDFVVTPESNPPTNIHVLIGSNGMGKTKLLNNLASCAVEGDGTFSEHGQLYDRREFGQKITHNYFPNVISTSFSVFDQNQLPKIRGEDASKVNYHHIGLKYIEADELKFKNITELKNDFSFSLKSFWGLTEKRNLWDFAIDVLNYVPNFPIEALSELGDARNSDELGDMAISLFKDLSSGHAVVLLTIAKIVERAEEKTLILIDEPENHLHPPLLSGLIRVISGILSKCNGVAIIATHSPVVLQEVPASCVWKIYRNGLQLVRMRPSVETFGEDVGMLTRDVFGLQVEQTGFHQLLSEAVDLGMSYEKILHNFSHQIGMDGRALLRALINAKRFD